MTAPKSLREQLIRDEGQVLYVYADSLGYQTIGVGRLVDQRRGGGISAAESAYLLDNDLNRIRAEVKVALPWTVELDEVRRDVLHAMTFQMGIKAFLLFKTTLHLVKSARWRGAADQMLLSQWAKQTPARAARLARQMEIGVRQ
jgi:lysozyme